MATIIGVASNPKLCKILLGIEGEKVARPRRVACPRSTPDPLPATPHWLSMFGVVLLIYQTTCSGLAWISLLTGDEGVR
jgi:hypothetical protein